MKEAADIQSAAPDGDADVQRKTQSYE